MKSPLRVALNEARRTSSSSRLKFSKWACAALFDFIHIPPYQLITRLNVYCWGDQFKSGLPGITGGGIARGIHEKNVELRLRGLKGGLN
jgi:hypothetical protein